MLTDIFLNRYAGVTLWETFEEKDRCFLVQGFRIISEQLYPYWISEGKESSWAKARWQVLHDKLSMEFGLEGLSVRMYHQIVPWQPSLFTIDVVCKNFVCVNYSGSVPADRFMKERLSFIEIAFRERADELEADASKSPRAPVLKLFDDRLKQKFQSSVEELNTRMKQAGYDLNYHNGFIQRSADPIIENRIEEPFWRLVSDAMWKNVDVDMKEALDRRDNEARDPAFYAARALESTIKIISEKKGWSHGGEKGPHSYIDNLASKRANQFIEVYEANALKGFFTHIRNPLGHGPGNEEMPALGRQQTDWAIEICMCWIKSLIRRM